MATHSFEQIDAAVQIFCESLREARADYAAGEAAIEAPREFSDSPLNRIIVEQEILQPA
jgi:hypothetical protein